MALFGYRVFDRIIYDACNNWRIDFRKTKDGTRTHVSKHIGCALNMVTDASGQVTVKRNFKPDALRKLDGSKGDSAYLKKLTEEIKPFSLFNQNNALNRVENFKNALFVLFMVQIRDQLREKEESLPKKLKELRKELKRLEKKEGDGTISDSEKVQLKNYRKIDESFVVDLDDVLEEERALSMKVHAGTETENDLDRLDVLREQIQKHRPNRYNFLLSEDLEGLKVAPISSQVSLTVSEQTIHNGDLFPGSGGPAEVDTQPSTLPPGSTDPDPYQGIISFFNDSTYALYCG